MKITLTSCILLKSLSCVDYEKQHLKSDSHTLKNSYAFEKLHILLCRPFCHQLWVYFPDIRIQSKWKNKNIINIVT